MKKILFYGLVFTLLLILNNSAYALCVNVSEANLRSGPGTKYEKTWQVFKYMPFKKINKKEDWYKIEDVDGDVHWIYSKLVTKDFRCAAVKTDKANIRSGPGTRFRKISLSPDMKYEPAIRYESFKVIKTKGSWVKVMDEFGGRGWIFRKLLWIQ